MVKGWELIAGGGIFAVIVAVCLVSIGPQPNQPPEASFSLPSFPFFLVDEPVQFTDTSVDNDGTLVGWSWNFGDNTPKSDTRNPVHWYAEAGTYTITLTAADDRGAVDDFSQTINVVGPLRASIEFVDGRPQLLVNGEQFVVRGVAYSPTPVGQDVAAGYNWWADPETYTSDFPMLKQMGANTIRTYDSTSATREALDAAYSNGIHVIMGYWVDHYATLSAPAVRQNMIDEFVSMVRKWKNHPAVLMWAFGNEVEASYTGNAEDWYTLLQEAAQAAHAEGGKNCHPVTTAHTDISHVKSRIGDASVKADDASLSALDVWGINAYRGYTFTNLFASYETKSAKPFLVTEFGCDAWDAGTGVENQTTQEGYIRSQWLEIESSLSPTGACLGGTVFEWCDEWWKAGAPSTHDETGQWPNPGYYDYAAGRNNMNEEWWGITRVSPGTYEKTPRKAYHVLKNLWTENVALGFTLTLSAPAGGAQPSSFIDLALDIRPSGGYSETISLSTSDLPGGMAINFDPENDVPPFASIVKISVGSGVESGSYSLEIVGTGADGRTNTCTYELEVGIYLDQVLYSDSVLPPSGAGILSWSGADWGGPAGSFENSYLGESPPEGSKCFKTTSGANWDDIQGCHVNYAGWGVFYLYPSEHTIDLSVYNYLKFWVKSPKNLKIEVQTGGMIGGKYTTYSDRHGWDGTDTWQEITVPRSAFKRADFTRIFGSFLATVEEPSTTFYIDNVRWAI